MDLETNGRCSCKRKEHREMEKVMNDKDRNWSDTGIGLWAPRAKGGKGPGDFGGI